jgi:hypothetical protein
MTHSLKNSVEDVLRQGCMLLDSASEETYVSPHAGAASGTIGAHYRHVLEHFACVLEGLRSGRINYDARKRDGQIESSITYARQVTQILIADFRAIPPQFLERDCNVISTVTYGESQAHEVGSTLAREVVYSIGHAIHHYAIIKLLSAGVGLQLPYEFGIAPSTLKHAAMGARGEQ